MPEFRKDPIADRWVIIAPERAGRPIGREASDSSPCPFCVGNEHMTPPEVLRLTDKRDASRGSNWTVRVVPNKYPAVVAEGSSTHTTDEGHGIHGGIGAHEVIIESPGHITDMALLEPIQLEAILRVYRDRTIELRSDKRFRYILIYKNQGIEAGATLEHVHSQLIALPMIPKLVLEEINAARNYHEKNRRCVFCDVVRKDTDAGERFVAENARYCVICPFAPRFPYETWILPKQHSSSFERSSPTDDVDLAAILRETVARLNYRLNRPAFNYFIHSNPLEQKENNYYHWHMEIIPKLIQVGGFEWGSGSYINIVTPEQSARSLREALP
ncbi:MAG TPA: galactose-1-phosphate uridylyltransferase [Candidatus Binatia bacterium]